MERRIPVYEALVTGEDTGMLRISLVDAPAVESDFQAFASQRAALQYRVADEERRLVRGVVMRADFPIYRNDGQFGEYYIVYRADTIRRMAEKYLRESRQNEVNLQHRKGSDVEGVQMVQWFIKDTAAGIVPEGFGDIADGSLFAEFHVVNDDVWAAVKEGTYRGFSLEGVFDLEPMAERMSAQHPDRVQQLAEKLIGNIDMSKLKKLREALAKALQELGSVDTDKGALVWDGDDDLRAGFDVYVEKDGNREAAPDGDYRTGDGKVIRVADGKVSEITDDRAEVAASSAKAAAQATVQAFAMSYDEKTRRIWDALRAKLDTEDFYVAEAGDDFAVAAVYDEDYYGRYMRYGVSWNGDTPEIGEGTEVRLAFIPKDMEVTFSSVREERDRAVADLARAKDEVKRLQTELAAAKSQPLARPAHEEVKGGAQQPGKTGNAGLDRLARYLSAE